MQIKEYYLRDRRMFVLQRYCEYFFLYQLDSWRLMLNSVNSGKLLMGCMGQFSPLAYVLDWWLFS